MTTTPEAGAALADEYPDGPITKAVRDGKVAVLVSPGFGVGWSTWLDDEHRLFAMFDHRLIAAFEAGGGDAVAKVVAEILGEDSGFYLGGAAQLTIEWIEQGVCFAIRERNGF